MPKALEDTLTLCDYARWLVWTYYMLGIDDDHAVRLAAAPPGTRDYELAASLFMQWVLWQHDGPADDPPPVA
jgi:hypothetical protein